MQLAACKPERIVHVRMAILAHLQAQMCRRLRGVLCVCASVRCRWVLQKDLPAELAAAAPSGPLQPQQADHVYANGGFEEADAHGSGSLQTGGAAA